MEDRRVAEDRRNLLYELSRRVFDLEQWRHAIAVQNAERMTAFEARHCKIDETVIEIAKTQQKMIDEIAVMKIGMLNVRTAVITTFVVGVIFLSIYLMGLTEFLKSAL